MLAEAAVAGFGMVAAKMSETRADWRPAAAVRSEMSGAGLSEDCLRFRETRLSQDGWSGMLDSGGFWKRLLAWERDW